MQRKEPAVLIVRFRHPQAQSIKSVFVNGKKWKNFDVVKEQIVIPHPREKKYIISARY
jgi:hypothetical protein